VKVTETVSQSYDDQPATEASPAEPTVDETDSVEPDSVVEPVEPDSVVEPVETPADESVEGLEATADVASDEQVDEALAEAPAEALDEAPDEALDEASDEAPAEALDEAPAEVGDEALDEAPAEMGDDAAGSEVSIDAPPADPLEEFRETLRNKFGDWFVIHTYSGMENRVKANLENRISSLNMEDFIYEVIVPQEEVPEIKNGQRRLVRRTVLPGYVLVRMDLTDESWSTVRHTPSVTGFVGHSHQPVPLTFDVV
jgi:transcriptional antiterminator NusG